jgi:hypothetical protein
MMQWAMFMTADGFAVAVCTGLLAHFKREDETMISGKLDEELSRMSDIADHRVHSLSRPCETCARVAEDPSGRPCGAIVNRMQWPAAPWVVAGLRSRRREQYPRRGGSRRRIPG